MEIFFKESLNYHIRITKYEKYEVLMKTPEIMEIILFEFTNIDDLIEILGKKFKDYDLLEKYVMKIYSLKNSLDYH